MNFTALMERFNETEIVNKFLDLYDRYKLYAEDTLSMNLANAALELTVGIIFFVYFVFVWLRRRVAKERRDIPENV